MRSLVRTLSVFALALVLSGAVRAEDKKPVEKKPEVKKDDVKKPAPAPFAGMFAFPKTITLSEEQTKKIDELKKEYTPKLEELKKKADAIDTAERKKAREAILKSAKENKTPKEEVAKSLAEAMKYTDEEKAQMKEIGTARSKLGGEINKKKMEVLTDEQKKLLAPKPKTEPKKTEK